MDFDTLYKQLNPQQRKAVDTLAGPVMVLAGPGTGKTQLLAVRVANILKKTDVYPSNILVLTYTNAGVQAMRERLASLMGSDGYDVVVETYHSFANDLISESELAISVKGDRVDMTDLERIKILEHLIDHLEGIRILRPGGAPYLYRQDIQTNISNLKRDGITPERFENFLVSYRPDGVVIDGKKLEKLKALAIVYRAYEEAKMPGAKLTVFDERGRYDFDDMILLATEALRSEPDLLAQYREQFQFAMVDEFQDSNGSQLELLSTIFGGERPNLCVVGDDDQSIYRFQGASAGNFHLIERLFPEVEKIVLDQNYRSKKEILESSAKLIRQVPDGERVSDKELEATRGKGDKTTVQTFRLGTPEEEMTFLVEEIKKIGKSRWNDTAVLVRTRKQADQLIESFLQAGIPYATDGKEDVRNEHRIQQLLKILRLAQNSMSYEEKDLLLFEIMLFDFWEIEHRDVMSLVNFVSERKSHKDKKKRRQGKKDKEFLKEETQHTMEFENEVCDEEQKDVSGYDKRPSLLRELMLRFPEPERDHFTEDQWPTEEESNNLSICEEIGLVDPNKLHRAAWTIKRVMDKATSYPVYSLMMKFLQDSEMVEYVLKEGNSCETWYSVGRVHGRP
jgi:DNA helicase II / ATP-dependent DNA helicase PcrA